MAHLHRLDCPELNLGGYRIESCANRCRPSQSEKKERVQRFALLGSQQEPNIEGTSISGAL